MLDRLAPEILPFDFDRDLIARVREGRAPEFRVYPFPVRAVVAGRGSDLEKEVDTAFCRSRGIPVFRRMGGGCSVFLDPGNLIVSAAFPAEGFSGIQRLFNRCTDWLINGFASLGLTGLYRDGISDLVLAGRKIGGSCLYRSKGFAYFSAAILVSPDMDLMDACLFHPPREPAYRQNRSHREFTTCLARHLPGMTPDHLARSLEKYLDPSAL